MTARYRLWRWVAPKLPTRKMRDFAWARKWRLWHALYDEQEMLWSAE